MVNQKFQKALGVSQRSFPLNFISQSTMYHSQSQLVLLSTYILRLTRRLSRIFRSNPTLLFVLFAALYLIKAKGLASRHRPGQHLPGPNWKITKVDLKLVTIDSPLPPKVVVERLEAATNKTVSVALLPQISSAQSRAEIEGVVKNITQGRDFMWVSVTIPSPHKYEITLGTSCSLTIPIG